MSKVSVVFKEFIHIRRFHPGLKTGLLLLLTVLIVCATVLMSYSGDFNKGLSENLIRLHVVANSDSPEDQALKRDVRDSIISYMKTQLQESQSMEQTKAIITDHQTRIEQLALDEMIKQGKSYSVKVMLGNYPFPTKAYGDVTLPAGEYQALKVVIGKGEGANWWCVLFPPLCFVDATHGTIPDKVKENLKSALTEEEFQLITTADNDDDIPIKVKFKVVEFFQDSKIKFSGMISRVFQASK
jgi:stage II sporulation protein R